MHWVSLYLHHPEARWSATIIDGHLHFLAEYLVQLADFGLSRVLDTGRTHVSTQTHGTLAYQPAELLQEGKLTKAADVHSFGMIMYEVYTHKRLFDGCNMGQVSLSHCRTPVWVQ